MSEIFKNSNLSIQQITLGMLENNVYLIESDNEKAIIDPSCECDKIIELSGDTNINKILLTHYHWDHIRAGAELVRKTGAKTYASIIDSQFIENPEKAPLYRKTDGFHIDIKLEDRDNVTIGQSIWTVISTPGHSPGSICFYCENDQPILISGDTLFEGTCGRYDFADGNFTDIKSSLKKLSQLNSKTIVFPGHGKTTTIKDELFWINQI